MQHTPITLTLEHPDAADGTPRQVARLVLDQLVDATATLVDVVEATQRQVRNAVLEEMIGEADDPEARTPEEAAELFAEWELGAQGRRLEHLGEATAELLAISRRLARLF